jgi:hypothetical protein
MKEGASTLDDVVTATYKWNDRKKRFSRRQIAVAFEVLRSKEWLAAA